MSCISGIYKITNNINQKIYIGSSRHCQKRKSEHKTVNNGTVIVRAIAKHGWANFSFEIIEKCSEALLATREQHWLDFYRSYERDIGYNVARDAACFSRGVKLSAEQRQAISRRLKGRPSPTKGHIFSEERRQV